MDDKYAGMGDSVQDINFKTVNLSGDAELDKEKLALLRGERDDAIIKLASFQGQTQDPYPSPFLNLSDTQIPKTTSEIFRWCKYFYTFDPLIAGAINALAAFPVTEIYVEDREVAAGGNESEGCKTYKRILFDVVKIYNLMIGIGIDYWLYGNCFVFGEMYINPNTGSPEWKNMIRLDPDRVIIDYNPVTQEKSYKWKVPPRIIDVIKRKKPEAEYAKIPELIREAVNTNKAVVLNSKSVFHFCRPTDSMGDNNVWGTPVVANVLKLLMYRNVLRQAQEAIAREHIVPMRVYYIQKSENYNVMADWNNVATSFAGELMKSVRDPNHKVVSPVPVGVLNIGGEGRQLLLTPEIEQVQNEVLAGMNVPREFIFGGVSYSSSSIALKILENQFITFRLLLKDFLQNFIIKNMAKARGEWINETDDGNLVLAKMVDLRMQDDVQQKQLIIELNRIGKIPDNHMWKMMGLDPDRIKAMLEKEAEDKVASDAKIQMLQMEAQFELQKKQLEQQMALQALQTQLSQKMTASGLLPQTDPMTGMPVDAAAATGQPSSGPPQPVPPPGPDTPPEGAGEPVQPSASAGEDSEATVAKLADRLRGLPEKDRDVVLKSLPSAYRARVAALMEQNAASLTEPQIDMRPMPEKLPPRRNSLK